MADNKNLSKLCKVYTYYCKLQTSTSKLIERLLPPKEDLISPKIWNLWPQKIVLLKKIVNTKCSADKLLKPSVLVINC